MEGEKDNCISFLDISITRDHTGTLDTNIYRKPTNSERYLNFKSEHPLELKSAVVNALTHRANSLIIDENEKRMELKHIQNVLTLNGYSNWLLNRKLKIKLDPPSASPATRNAVETRGIAILPYIPNLSEKLKLILLRHGIRIVFKPPQKLCGLLSSFKDAIEPGYWQGAIYKINCSDCDQCYIGLNAGLKRKKRNIWGTWKVATTTQQLSLSTRLNLAIQSIGKTTKFCKLKLTITNANSLNRFI